MEMIIVWSDTEVFEVFGPFPDDDAAREWAEATFPRRHWTMHTMTAPSN